MNVNVFAQDITYRDATLWQALPVAFRSGERRESLKLSAHFQTCLSKAHSTEQHQANITFLQHCLAVRAV